jgi:hypothetical protein
LLMYTDIPLGLCVCVKWRVKELAKDVPLVG